MPQPADLHNSHKLMNRVVSIIKPIIRLYTIHIFACIAIAESIYFPGLDVALAFLYLTVIGVEVLLYSQAGWCRSILAALIWQLPGLILSLISIVPAGGWGVANYGFFALEFWYTPLVPLLSLLWGWAVQGKPLYYYLLLAAPLIMLLYCYLLVLLGGRLRPALTSIKVSQRT